MGTLGRPAARAPINTGDIPDNIITSAKIAPDVLTAADIAPNAVTASELADDAVVNASVASGAAIAIGKLAGTASRALETDGSGVVQVSAITTTELAKLDGITSTAVGISDSQTLTNKTLTTPAGIVKGDVGLGNVDNTTDALKPVSTAATTALNLKAPLAGPTFTGNATAANLTVSGDIVPSTPLSHRNMIINGGMQVWQRSTGVGVTIGAGNAINTVDRFRWQQNTDGNYKSEKYTMTSAELNTTGHSSAAKLTCLNVDAGTPAASHYAYIQHKIEAQNLQHLQYGTANAKTLTLSFWVKSSLTGTYCVGLVKGDATSHYIPIEYTISTADTWEQKKIIITPTAGSTALITHVDGRGKINNDNGTGLSVDFILSAGATYHGTNNTWTASDVKATSNQVNWLDSVSSRTFYITGVQLELGSNATPFEHRSYTEELDRCKRYFQESFTLGMWLFAIECDNSGGYRRNNCFFRPTMRVAPTIVIRTTPSGYATQNASTGMMSMTYNGIGSSTYREVPGFTADAEL
jgi:hypothetical protein